MRTRVGWSPALMMLMAAVMVTQCKGTASKIESPLPSDVDLSTARQVEVRNEAGQTVLNGTFENGKTRLASADPTMNAAGHAEFEVEKSGDRTKQEIEATVEELPPATTFRLVVDGREVTTFMTGADGKREMKLTREGASS